MNPFKRARDVVSELGRSRNGARLNAMLGRIGPDGGSRVYRDGQHGSKEPIHAQVFGALRSVPAPPCRVPFEVRIPRPWIAKIAATYRIHPSDLYISRLANESSVVRAWAYGEVEDCTHGDACAFYREVAADVRCNGYSERLVRTLSHKVDEMDLSTDRELLLRFARALAVGAGRTRDPVAAKGAKRLSVEWLSRYESSGVPDVIDSVNLMRSLAFAEMVSDGGVVALETVRRAAQRLHDIDAVSVPEGVRFRIREASFPTLETLSLCEERWGSVRRSIEAASLLVDKFPNDGRSWVRLSKSYLAAKQKDHAVLALLRAASAEHAGWLANVLSAFWLAGDSEIVAEVVEFAASFGFARSDIEDLDAGRDR